MSVLKTIKEIFSEKETFNENDFTILCVAILGHIPEWTDIMSLFGHNSSFVSLKSLIEFFKAKQSSRSIEDKILEIFEHLAPGFLIDEEHMADLFQELGKPLHFDVCLEAFRSLSTHNNGIGLDYTFFRKLFSKE